MAKTHTRPHELMELAAERLEQALALLDRAEAPAHIGAHVDLALCQLRDLFGEPEQAAGE